MELLQSFPSVYLFCLSFARIFLQRCDGDISVVRVLMMAMVPGGKLHVVDIIHTYSQESAI